MTGLLFYLVLVSLVGLLVMSIRQSRELGNFRLLAVHVVILCVFSFVIWLFFQRSGVLTSRGVPKENELSFIGGLYVLMFLGLLSHSGYKKFVRAGLQKTRLGFGLFLAPVFASTLVSLPLLASLQNEVGNIEGMAATKTMVFFVAFVNGFLWKEYFESRAMELASVARAEKPVATFSAAAPYPGGASS